MVRVPEREKKRWDKMELHAMVKYWVGVFEKVDVWNDARSNEKENQSKITTKRTFTPFYCFGGFSFACWIYFVHISWAPDHMLFRMLSFLHASKISFVTYFFLPFFVVYRLQQLLLLPPWGFWYQFFFLPQCKGIHGIHVCVYEY